MIKHENQKGMGIAIALISIVIISLLGTALLFRSMTLSEVVNQKNYSITAIESAKGGVARAIYELENNINYSTAIPATSLNNYTITPVNERGYYSVQINNNMSGSLGIPRWMSTTTGNPVPSDCVEIISTGYAGNPNTGDAKKTIKIIAIGHKDMTDNSLFNYAAFGITSVTASGASGDFSDSYDSTLGPYGGSNTGNHGNVGSNGKISTGSKKINGDIYLYGTNTFTGSQDPDSGIKSLGTPLTLQTPVAPTIPAGIISGTTYNPGSYGKLSLSGKKTATLVSGTYVFTSISISGNGQIIVDPSGGPVNIYVTGTVSISGNGIANSGNPTDLFIYGTGSTSTGNWSISGNGGLTAAVFAPNNAISYSGGGSGGQVYGSLIGKTVSFSGNSSITVHYDEALGKLSGGNQYNGINKLTWVVGF